VELQWFFNNLLEWIATLNDPYQHRDNCKEEQEMHIRAQRVKRYHPQQPKDYENYGDRPQHGMAPFSVTLLC